MLQAFRTIKCFLGKLEKVSENPDLTLEAGRQQALQRWMISLRCLDFMQL